MKKIKYYSLVSFFTLGLVLSGCQESKDSDQTTIVHNGTEYKVLTSPITGKQWLDRNLGATSVCTKSRDDFKSDKEYITDQKACFGDLYQWGRLKDGHEKINSSSSKNLKANDITSIKNNSFITVTSSPYDWTSLDSNGNLRKTQWSKTDGSSVCPTGFRVPTIQELRSETVDYYKKTDEAVGAVKVINRDTAFKNFLKMPTAGYRNGRHSGLSYQGAYGHIWSTSVNANKSVYLNFTKKDAGEYKMFRETGFSVRCIKG